MKVRNISWTDGPTVALAAKQVVRLVSRAGDTTRGSRLCCPSSNVIGEMLRTKRPAPGSTLRSACDLDAAFLHFRHHNGRCRHLEHAIAVGALAAMKPSPFFSSSSFLGRLMWGLMVYVPDIQW